MKLNDFLNDFLIFPDLKYRKYTKDLDRDRLHDIIDNIFHMYGNDAYKITNALTSFYKSQKKININNIFKNTEVKDDDFEAMKVDDSVESYEKTPNMWDPINHQME